MSAAWAKLESHLVNGAFPLQRCIGSTDHSGVFLTQSTPHAPSAAALKLVPLDSGEAEEQLARWRASVDLSHPHLVRIFEVGECVVDGQDYLYARMELADQTLAQVLENRPLTEDEVREMLVPMLDALGYLHGKDLVQGALKPANVLVVGNQLKLASDTLREVGDPDEDVSTAADIHALGVTLCEALTRRRPSGLEGAGGVVLPPELPAAFRDIVSRCLRRDPRTRPTVADLQAWLSGAAMPAESPAVAPLVVERPAPAPAPKPNPAAAPAPIVAAPTPASPARLVIRVELPSEERAAKLAGLPDREKRSSLPLVIGAVVLAALGWTGYRLLAKRSPPPPAATEAAREEAPARVDAPAPSTVPEPVVAVPAPAPVPAPVRGPAVNEVIPTISQSSLDTVRGTIRVVVRVSVDRRGTVVDATPDDPGPSRYFERKSLESARKWTFVPSDSDEPRSMRVRFAYTRGGVTASAEALP